MKGIQKRVLVARAIQEGNSGNYKEAVKCFNKILAKNGSLDHDQRNLFNWCIKKLTPTPTKVSTLKLPFAWLFSKRAKDKRKRTLWTKNQIKLITKKVIPKLADADNENKVGYRLIVANLTRHLSELEIRKKYFTKYATRTMKMYEDIWKFAYELSPENSLRLELATNNAKWIHIFKYNKESAAGLLKAALKLIPDILIRTKTTPEIELAKKTLNEWEPNWKETIFEDQTTKIALLIHIVRHTDKSIAQSTREAKISILKAAFEKSGFEIYPVTCVYQLHWTKLEVFAAIETFKEHCERNNADVAFVYVSAPGWHDGIMASDGELIIDMELKSQFRHPNFKSIPKCQIIVLFDSGRLFLKDAFIKNLNLHENGECYLDNLVIVHSNLLGHPGVGGDIEFNEGGALASALCYVMENNRVLKVGEFLNKVTDKLRKISGQTLSRSTNNIVTFESKIFFY